MCPPEGDAGTGMAATNAVKQRTGNVSAGTSSFSMIVLEKELSQPYEMLDMVTTPDGSLVAMVHCNNCTSDINAWVKIMKEYAELLGVEQDNNQLYTRLFQLAAIPTAAVLFPTTTSPANLSPAAWTAVLWWYALPTTSSRLPTSCVHTSTVPSPC